MRIFGSVQPQSESTFPFLNIIFQKMPIFGAPSFTLDRNMRPLTFLHEIQKELINSIYN